MKKNIKSIQDEFVRLFQTKLEETGLKYVGCDPVETNEHGDPLPKQKLPKGYTKDYVKILKEFEIDLLNYKTKLMK